MPLDKFGREIPDPQPVAIPAGFKRPETLQEQVARLVRHGLSQRAQAEGFESFEEANDFEVNDEDDPRTPYEEIFDPALGRSITPWEMQKYEQQYRKEFAQRLREDLQDEERGNALRAHVEELRAQVRAKQSGGRRRADPAPQPDGPDEK